MGSMYSKIFQHILNPFFEKIIKRRKMLDYRNFLEKSQWWPREKLLDFQWQELKKLLDHAYHHVPYWREKFQKLGLTPTDVRNYTDFQRLPVTTKNDIRTHKDKMMATDYRGGVWSKYTGGSTGMPLELDYTPDSFDWRVAVWKRGYAWAGCEDGMRQFWLWGTMLGRKSALRALKESLHYALMQKKYFICHGMDDRMKAECVSAINRFCPEIIIGYTNPLFAVAQYIEQNGGLKARPKSIISAAEKLYEPQRTVIERAFGCQVFDTYGCREVMLVGAECGMQRGFHLSAENLFVEVLREDGTVALPGEKGDMVLTDLHNYGMPLIRYQNEDIGILSPSTSCPCGRGLPLLADIVGRTLDLIRTPEGKDVSGEFFVIVMLDKLGVDRYRFTQERLDYLGVDLIKNEKFSEKEFQAIKEQVLKVVGSGMKVEYRFVKELPVNRTGKFRVTVSQLSENKT